MPKVFIKELGVPGFQLEQRWVKKLVDVPETAMGYQLVDIKLKDGRVIERLWVANCSWIVPGYGSSGETPFEDGDIVDITMNPAGIRHGGPKITLNRST